MEWLFALPEDEVGGHAGVTRHSVPMAGWHPSSSQLQRQPWQEESEGRGMRTRSCCLRNSGLTGFSLKQRLVEDVWANKSRWSHWYGYKKGSVALLSSSSGRSGHGWMLGDLLKTPNFCTSHLKRKEMSYTLPYIGWDVLAVRLLDYY